MKSIQSLIAATCAAAVIFTLTAGMGGCKKDESAGAPVMDAKKEAAPPAAPQPTDKPKDHPAH